MQAAIPDKYLEKTDRQTSFWLKLSRRLNLAYSPVSGATGNWQHRLIGLVDKHLVIVRFAEHPQANVKLLLMELYHGSTLDADSVQTHFHEDQTIQRVFGRNRKRIEVFEHVTRLPLPYNYKRRTVEETQEKIREFIRCVSCQVGPTAQDKCEAVNCGCTNSETPRLVLVDHLPIFLCQNGIQNAVAEIRQSKASYDQSPTDLIRGIPVGLVFMLAGAIFWAATTKITDGGGMFFAPVIIVVVILVSMTRLGVKSGMIVWLVSCVMTLGSTLFGIYLLELFDLVQNSSKFEWKLVVDAFTQIISEMNLVDALIPITTVILAFTGLIYWFLSRNDYRETFFPLIEVFEDLGLPNQSFEHLHI